MTKARKQTTKVKPRPRSPSTFLKEFRVQRKALVRLDGDYTIQADDKIPNDITFDGTLDFKAGEKETDDDTFFLLANTGKPVQLGNFPHPVIVDMEGASFDKQKTPVIADHDTKKRIGHTTEQIILKHGERRTVRGRELVGPVIAAYGVRSSDSQISREFKSEAKKGFPFQVSIGARIRKGYILEEGKKAKINGRTWEGPLVVASLTKTKELTVTVLGADNDTSAIFAKEQDMNFEQWLATLKLSLDGMDDDQREALEAEYKKLYPPSTGKKKAKTKTKIKATEDDPEEDEDDDDDDSAPVTRRKVKAKSKSRTIQASDDAAENEERIDAIRELTEEFQGSVKEVEIEAADGETKKLPLAKFKAHAIRNQMSATDYELSLRRSSLPDFSGHGPSIQSVNKDISARALEVSILRYYGHGESEKNAKTGVEYGLKAMGYTDKELELSHQRQHRFHGTISELLGHQIAAAGRHPTVFMQDGSVMMTEAVRAWNDIKAASGASALLITNILENTMHKATYASFEATETTWRNITGVRSLNDFRAHNNYVLDYNGHFRKVPTDGELKHIGMRDTKYTLSAETYGAMIAVDRKTRIDDDLGMVMTKARGIGSLAAMRIEEAIYVLLLANTGSFFHANNGNLITGAGTALGIAAFTTAKQKYRDQIINGKPISVSPSILLVGTNNEVLAERLYKETRMQATGDTDAVVFTDNPHAGWVRPVVSGYLNNTAITDQDGAALSGQSNNHWYLFSNPNVPQGSALCIGFLNGRQTPFIDEAETQFNVPGGIQMRVYFDFGVAFHVKQLALRSAGS